MCEITDEPNGKKTGAGMASELVEAILRFLGIFEK
jgi:hypothetical protein